MADYTILKEAIAQVIKTNGNQEITGLLLQQTLISLIDDLNITKEDKLNGEKTYIEKLKEVLIVDEEQDTVYTTKSFYSTKGVSAYGASESRVSFLAFTINEDMELIQSIVNGVEGFEMEVVNGELILKTI